MAGREDESLFARGDDDALVRREKETRDRFAELVTVVIDGYPVTIPRAVPKTDAQGNPLRDADGGLIPRTSTIYDAAVRLATGYADAAGDRVPPAWTDDALKARLPVLCHQPHLNPVGVCRMCSVHISSMKRGQLTPGRKLVPACQHRVEANMVVTTRAGLDGYNPADKEKADPRVARFAATVNESVKLLAEFLLADHRHPALTEARRYENELEQVAAALGVAVPRPSLPRPPRPAADGVAGRNALAAAGPADRVGLGLAAECRDRRIPLPVASPELEEDDPADPAGWEKWNAAVDARYPYSSRTVVVDHDRCILCDRCVRSCTDVKGFNVIGHTGKGYTARVSFDLDQLMGQSSCVQCGECMTSCPTGALSLRRRVRPRNWDDSLAAIPLNPNTPFPAGSDFLSADEMRAVRLRYVSPNSGPRVVYPFRSIPYAYLKWNEGAVRRWVIRPGERRTLCREGDYGSSAFLLEGTGQFEIRSRGTPDAQKPGLFARLFGRSEAAPGDDLGGLIRTATGDELILGEMACLTNRTRTATVVAAVPADNPGIVWGHDENGWPTAALDSSATAPAVVYEVTRNLLHVMQRSAAARSDLEEMYTFRAVEACVRRGQLFRHLDAATRQAVTAFLLGSPGLEFRRLSAGEVVVAEGEPAADFYMVRLGSLRVYQTAGGQEQVLRVLSDEDSFGELALLRTPPGRRAASVAALDPAEVVRVPGGVFRALVEKFPAVRDALQRPAPAVGPGPGLLAEYTARGVYQGQRLLALDLLSCTRCDECTKACADSHDGHARLLRDGRRFGNFLLATSCRSCHTPYCMDGCPVDAIHRRGDRLEVVIEDHCIGCGLCDRNCPYGSIHMVPRGVPNPSAAGFPGGDPGWTAAPRRAVNCDQCGPVGGEPFCVSACPHDAAFRLDGKDLLAWVAADEARGS